MLRPAAVAAFVLCAGTDGGRRIAATAASALLEAAPFALAAMVVGSIPWARRLLPWLSCGCAGDGPAFPAIAAAAWLFGPAVAALRLAAEAARSALRGTRPACAEPDAVLPVLGALLVPAVAAGVLAEILATGAAVPSPGIQGLAGLAAGLLASPCSLGAVVLAGALRHTLPAAAIPLALSAGMLRRTRLHAHGDDHDGGGYALAAAACLSAAARGGAALVRPELALLLWACAFAFGVLARRHRHRRAPRLRVAAAVMLLGTVVAASPPQYHATETTLANAFPGESVDFTGEVTRTRGAATLVRYAIVCCRADAAPIVLRLADAPRSLRGWMHARGTLVPFRGTLALRARSLESIAAPRDPFVYR